MMYKLKLLVKITHLQESTAYTLCNITDLDFIRLCSTNVANISCTQSMCRLMLRQMSNTGKKKIILTVSHAVVCGFAEIGLHFILALLVFDKNFLHLYKSAV